MKNQSEYAVLRFVNQGSGFHMIHDYIKGSTIIHYAKKGNKVQKEVIYLWMEQLAAQLEHCMLCEEQEVYGEVNPYSVIVAEDNKILLLDLDADSNREMIKRMRKKKIRSLFVSKGRVLSKNTQPEDDFYGFAQVLKFMVDRCCVSERYSRIEEKGLVRVMNICMKSDEYEEELWKEIRGELRKLRNRTVCHEEKKKRKPGKWMKIILILLGAVCCLWLNKSIVSAWVGESMPRDIKRSDPGLNRAYREAGLIYYSDFNDMENSFFYLDRCAQNDRMSRIYLQLLRAVKYGVNSEADRLELNKNLEDGQRCLKQYDKRNRIYDRYIYYLPFIEIYSRMESNNAVRQIIAMCEKILSSSKSDQNIEGKNREIRIREYLAEAYEKGGYVKEEIKNYQKLKVIEKDSQKLEKVYENLSRLYVKEGQQKKSIKILQEGTLMIPESEELWMDYLEICCSDENIDKETCLHIIQEAVEENPSIKENERFDELKQKLEIES